jgi:hypothetical protein
MHRSGHNPPMKATRHFAAPLVLSIGCVLACGGGGEKNGSGGNDQSGGTNGSGANGSGASGGSATGASGGAAQGGTSSGATGGASGAAGGSAGSGGNVTIGECGAIATFEDAATPSQEIFVDATAAGPGDGSEGDPFTTLDPAFDAATPGTAIRIRPGTYTGGAFVEGLTGSAEAPIWIGGVAGEERPVISGGDNAIQLSGASFVIVHDLEVTGQTSNGLNVDDAETASGLAHDLVFRDLYIHDIGDGDNQDCLKLSGIDDFFVLDSEFVGCSAGSAIDHVGCHHGVIARNVFSELGGNGVQSKGGSDDILITQNQFLNAGERAVNMGGSTGFEFFRPALSVSGENYEARDIRVVANLFRGGVSPIAFVGCVDCLAANNTLIDPDHWVVRILQETTSTSVYTFSPASDGRFVNNIVYYELGLLSTHVNVGGETSPESFVFSNNLWYAYDAAENSEPGGVPTAETAGVYGEDPAFLSAEDASITASSPAAGAGVEVEEVPGDINGNCYLAPPAIGAYEIE